MKQLYLFLICLAGILVYGAFKMFSPNPTEDIDKNKDLSSKNEFMEMRIGDTVVVAKVISPLYRQTHQSYIVSEAGDILFTIYNCDTAVTAYYMNQDLSEPERIKLSMEAARAEIPAHPDARYTLLSILLMNEDYQSVHNEIVSYPDYKNFALLDALALSMLGGPVDISIADLKPDDKMKLEFEISLIGDFLSWQAFHDKPTKDVAEAILALVEKGWKNTSYFYKYMIYKLSSHLDYQLVATELSGIDEEQLHKGEWVCVPFFTNYEVQGDTNDL